MELILLTDYRGALRQRQQIWQSLDVEAVREHLRAEGIATRLLRFEDQAGLARLQQGALIHYTSTQDPGYRPLVDAVLHHLDASHTLVPRYEIFRAHEDKVYQELLRRRRGLPGPAARVFGNLRGALDHTPATAYPLVFKAARGFQSTGVHLVRDQEALKRLVRRLQRPAGHAVYRIKEFLKKHLFTRRYHAEMYRDCPFSGPFILQEYLPGLAGDWKVLVYGDHFYALNRAVRPGDFRASGSGRFTFATPPGAVLDCAAEVRDKLDVPMASLDIVETAEGCRLIEFQGLHFGTWTVDMAPGYYQQRDGGWEFNEGARPLEEEYARALARHLKLRRAREDRP